MITQELLLKIALTTMMLFIGSCAGGVASNVRWSRFFKKCAITCGILILVVGIISVWI